MAKAGGQFDALFRQSARKFGAQQLKVGFMMGEMTEEKFASDIDEGHEHGVPHKEELGRALLHAWPHLVVIIVKKDDALRMRQFHGDLQVVISVLRCVTTVDGKESEAPC